MSPAECSQAVDSVFWFALAFGAVNGFVGCLIFLQLLGGRR